MSRMMIRTSIINVRSSWRPRSKSLSTWRACPILLPSHRTKMGWRTTSNSPQSTILKQMISWSLKCRTRTPRTRGSASSSSLIKSPSRAYKSPRRLTPTTRTSSLSMALMSNCRKWRRLSWRQLRPNRFLSRIWIAHRCRRAKTSKSWHLWTFSNNQLSTMSDPNKTKSWKTSWSFCQILLFNHTDQNFRIFGSMSNARLRKISEKWWTMRMMVWEPVTTWIPTSPAKWKTTSSAMAPIISFWMPEVPEIASSAAAPANSRTKSSDPRGPGSSAKRKRSKSTKSSTSSPTSSCASSKSWASASYKKAPCKRSLTRATSSSRSSRTWKTN